MKEKILLVEDDVDNREVASAILKHYGYQVLEAKEGKEALEMVKKEIPDLILMDMALPGVSGWEVTRRLKRNPCTSQIPIIALTAYAMRKDKEKAFKLGCEGYLSKPISPQKIIEEVKRVLEEKIASKKSHGSGGG
ncbi:MAG TPA: response regulator [bacterium]|nr:response regulator [bacterium]HEX67686.1 response regulator [bacterium]